MTVGELYTAYRIMPGLQMHQLRVAAVGKMICGNFAQPLDAEAVVLACLFHDMGNIIKSNLDIFPGFCEPEGKEYWQKIKDEWIAEYGSDAHQGTMAIVRKIGLPEHVIQLIDGVGFSRLKKTRDSSSFEQKITEYADCRVAPLGILSMEERLADTRKRYAGRIKNNDMPEPREDYDSFLDAAREVERQIFSRASIRPEDITDASAAPFIEELREYRVA